MVVAMRVVAKNEKQHSHSMIREKTCLVDKAGMPQYHQYRREYKANRFIVTCV